MDMYDNDFYKNAVRKMEDMQKSMARAVDELDSVTGQIASNVSAALQKSSWDDSVGANFKQLVVGDAQKHVSEFCDLYRSSLVSAVEGVQSCIDSFKKALGLWYSHLD